MASSWSRFHASPQMSRSSSDPDIRTPRLESFTERTSRLLWSCPPTEPDAAPRHAEAVECENGLRSDHVAGKYDVKSRAGGLGRRGRGAPSPIILAFTVLVAIALATSCGSDSRLLGSATATSTTTATPTPSSSSTTTTPAASGTTRPAGSAGSPAAPAPTTLSAPPATTAPPPNAPPPTSPPQTTKPVTPPTTAPPTTAPPLPKVTSAQSVPTEIHCQGAVYYIGVVVVWTTENATTVDIDLLSADGQRSRLAEAPASNGNVAVSILCDGTTKQLRVQAFGDAKTTGGKPSRVEIPVIVIEFQY